MIRAATLKHQGSVKEIATYTETGQAETFKTLFNFRFGIQKQAIEAADQENNTGNKQTLALFTRYDARLQNGQTMFAFGTSFTVSQLDNVEFANRRLNFTATEL